MEERIQIVRKCTANGKNYGELSLKHQANYEQFRIWTLCFEQMGDAGLEDRRCCRKKDQTSRTKPEQVQTEIEKLKHRLYLAEMENTLLRQYRTEK